MHHLLKQYRQQRKGNYVVFKKLMIIAHDPPGSIYVSSSKTNKGMLPTAVEIRLDTGTRLKVVQ